MKWKIPQSPKADLYQIAPTVPDAAQVAMEVVLPKIAEDVAIVEPIR